MKKLKFPTAQTVLLIIAAFVAMLTWVIPAGQFDRLTYDKQNAVFIKTSFHKTLTLEGSQNTLDQLMVKIPLEKFTSGDISKPISIPNTYKTLEAKPQGLIDYILSPIQGIIKVSDIMLFVLIIGGLVGIVNFTGAFEAGISWLSRKLEGKEYVLIIVVTTLIALGGTTFGMAEETMAFFPILIPVFLAAKYDALVPVACIFIGSSIGTMASTVNPFSTIIASDAAGINWTTGIIGRIIMLLGGLIICIAYILRYAKRVLKDPTQSLIYSQKEDIERLFPSFSHSIRLTARLKLILIVFVSSFMVMVYGVSQLDWWFLEMTAVFLVSAVIIGFIAKIKEAVFVDTFVKGANQLLSVAFIIGIARGISILMDDGLISDTILFYGSNLTEGMNKGLFINVLFLIYNGLSFFISSSSGMAVLTMPIMSPLADGVGIGREFIINAYQYGMGLFNFINPTGLILASLAMAKIGFDKWLKFIMPLMLILLVFTMAFLTISVYI
ncbi:YfcC family protein [Flavobacteriaceae bacterium LMO-SS05]